MVTIWSLVPLPFLKPAWRSGSSRFTYCWSLAWKIQQWSQDWKRLVFIPIPKKDNAMECSNTRLHSSHTLSKTMLKILQARLQHYVNWEIPDIQAGFRKGRKPEIKLPTSTGSWKKQESTRKTSISALLTMPKPLTVWITINCGKFFRDGNTRPPDLPLEKCVCRSGSNS